MVRSLRLPCFVALVLGVFASPVSSDDCLELVGRWPYGPASAVAVSGDYAYFASGPSLMVADISDPTSPQVVGEVELGDRVIDMAVEDAHVYLATDQRRLAVVDVSAPLDPVEVGSHEFGTDMGHIEVADGYAYVTLGDSGLLIIDVTTPSAPVEVGVFEEEAVDVALAGHYAYVVSSHRLHVIDVSVPSAPMEIGSWPSDLYTKTVAVSGDFAYVASRDEFQVFDISDPSQPKRVGETRTGGWETVEEMAVFGSNVMLVGTGYWGAEVFDVTTASAPIRLNSLYIPWSGYGLSRSGELAAIAGGAEGLVIMDMSSPGCVVEIGAYSTPGIVRDVAVAGGFAYVADEDDGFRVIDVSTPTAPVEVWSYDPPDRVSRVAVDGDRAYASAGFGGLLIFDVSDPRAPRHIGVYDPPDGVGQVVASGAFVFINAGGFVRVVDVSDPASPLEVATVDGPQLHGEMVVSDGHLFLADRYEGLRVIDVRTPSAPVEVSRVDTPGWTTDVAVGGGYAFLTDDDGGLKVIDVGEPSAPEEMCYSFESRTGSNNLGSVIVSDDRVFASTAMGLFVADLSAPCTPVFLGKCQAYYFPDAVSGRYGFVATQNPQLVVLDMGGPFGPSKVGDTAVFGASTAVDTAGGFSFFAESGGLRIMDMETPASLEEVGFLEVPLLFDVEVSAGHAYVLNGADESLRVVDVSDPWLPVEVAATGRLGYDIHDVEVSGSYALIAGNDYAHILDVSVPSSPAWVEWMQIFMEEAAAEDLEISGDLVYVVGTYGGLQVYDLATPSSPQLVGRHPSLGGAAISIVGTTAYVGQLWGLLLLDITDPLAPVPVSFFPTVSRLIGIATSGTCVFVLDDEYVWAVDVSTPSAPVEVGIHETTGPATDLAVLGNHLYVTEGWAGFEVFDISSCPGALSPFPAPRQGGGRRVPGSP